MVTYKREEKRFVENGDDRMNEPNGKSTSAVVLHVSVAQLIQKSKDILSHLLPNTRSTDPADENEYIGDWR